MDVMKVLAELRQERQQLEEAIMTLERLARSRGKRRGRPPAWMSQGGSSTAVRRKKTEGTEATQEPPKQRGRPKGSRNKPKIADGTTPITDGKSKVKVNSQTELEKTGTE